QVQFRLYMQSLTSPLFRQNGRNIVIASKDKKENAMDQANAKKELQKFTVDFEDVYNFERVVVYYGKTRLSSANNAEEFYYKADKTGSCSFAVVDTFADINLVRTE
ncbi:unnamed protein product, partial [Owenia fusiformis]